MQFQLLHVCFPLSSDPAEITKFEVTPKTVTENHTFDISCTIIGNPAPKYSIQMDAENKTLISDKGSGTVTVTSWNVTCEDAGYWICTGYNYLNKHVNVTKGDNITVLCKYEFLRKSCIRPCHEVKKVLAYLI